MYEALKEIEETNFTCRAQLTALLSGVHDVKLIKLEGVPRNNEDEQEQKAAVGAAFFFAFDPWDTCLRLPSNSFRYFTAAETVGLINKVETRNLLKLLFDQSVKLEKAYSGHFDFYLRSRAVRSTLAAFSQLDYASEIARDSGQSAADRLFEECPWPIIPGKNLKLTLFEDAQTSAEVNLYSKAPWLAWAETLDLICLGPWLGFKHEQIVDMVKGVWGERQQAKPGGAPSSPLGKKVILPLFSTSFQGVVVGFFRNVLPENEGSIVTTLNQFGQTLANVYSSLRVQQLAKCLEEDMSAKVLAREVINAISPVRKVVVEHRGERFGFQINKEESYWAGYSPLSQRELSADWPEHCIKFVWLDSVIYVEPISDVPQLDEVFARVRLENSLAAVFGSSPRGEAALQVDEVKHQLAELQEYVNEKNPSLAKLRQYYIVSQVEKNWDAGETKVSNIELKNFLERRLDRKINNGYQVTSFLTEVQKIFDDRISVAKTRNALSLSWQTDG